MRPTALNEGIGKGTGKQGRDSEAIKKREFVDFGDCDPSGRMKEEQNFQLALPAGSW